MLLVPDDQVRFPAVKVRGNNGGRTLSKTEMRQVVALQGLVWIKCQYERGVPGAIMIDIDDTLIDGNEKVANGFEFMHKMWDQASRLYPIHVVTARPDDDHRNVMNLLHDRGFKVQTHMLHMLPAQHYGKSSSYVEDFKWKTFIRIHQMHNGVVARFGDKLWDVAHLEGLRRGVFDHIDDREAYLFYDPNLPNTFSGKLPG